MLIWETPNTLNEIDSRGAEPETVIISSWRGWTRGCGARRLLHLRKTSKLQTCPRRKVREARTRVTHSCFYLEMTLFSCEFHVIEPLNIRFDETRTLRLIVYSGLINSRYYLILLRYQSYDLSPLSEKYNSISLKRQHESFWVYTAKTCRFKFGVEVRRKF